MLLKLLKQLRKPVISKAARMVTKYFLKNKLPFQYNLVSMNLERISLIKLKTANQIFRLDFKPRREDFFGCRYQMRKNIG